MRYRLAEIIDETDFRRTIKEEKKWELVFMRITAGFTKGRSS